MFDKVQLMAKQRYAQELAAYTLMQWNDARGAAEAKTKPLIIRRSSTNELSPSQQRRNPLARSRSAMSSASSSEQDHSVPASTAASRSPTLKAVDYSQMSPPPVAVTSSSPSCQSGVASASRSGGDESPP